MHFCNSLSIVVLSIYSVTKTISCWIECFSSPTVVVAIGKLVRANTQRIRVTWFHMWRSLQGGRKGRKGRRGESGEGTFNNGFRRFVTFFSDIIRIVLIVLYNTVKSVNFEFSNTNQVLLKILVAHMPQHL